MNKFDDRAHWSASQISCYISCPRKYYFRYIAKVKPEKYSDNLAFGKNIHRVVDEFFKSRSTDKEFSPDQACDLFAMLWEKEDGVSYSKSNTFESLKDKGAAMLKLYLEDMAEAEIEATEQPFTVPLIDEDGNVLEKPLVGVLDMVSEDCIIELKTAGRRFDDFRLKNDIQATAYAYAISKLYGERRVLFRWDVLLKTKQPAIERYYVIRGEEDYTRLVDTVKTISRAIENGIFYPACSSMSCAMCDYTGECAKKAKVTV